MSLQDLTPRETKVDDSGLYNAVKNLVGSSIQMVRSLHFKSSERTMVSKGDVLLDKNYQLMPQVKT